MQGHHGGQPRVSEQELHQMQEALPTFTFDKEKFKNCGEENKDKLECRICIMEFENGQELR